MNKLRTPRPRAQRGAATLIVVMVLFFIVSLVAAYAGRNLIFEQRTSANQYRATQAFEAAEAGLEWALAMLNGGRVDPSCGASIDAAHLSFRARYLEIDDIDVTPKTWADGSTLERPSCVRTNNPLNPWSCSCPDKAAPTPAVPADGGIHPAFRVCFEAVNPPQPGVVRVVSTGRTSFVDQPCEQRGEGTAGDSAATVSVVVALNSGLATPPSAALTVRGSVSVTAPTTLQNVDPLTNGLTASIGQYASSDIALLKPESIPGSPVDASIIHDTVLEGLSQPQLFTSLFRMHPDTYKNQPATVVLTDCAATCSEKLRLAVERNPGRIIWVNGDLALESAVDLGPVVPTVPPVPPVPPVVIVASGSVRIFEPVNIVGLLYSGADIQNFAAGSLVRGAAVAAGNFESIQSARIEYDPEVLKLLNLYSGSLVRVPGSWRDFP